MSLIPDITVRRPYLPGEHIFLIGPGGVGKSTLGAELARMLAWPVIDLDLEFCDRLGIIGPFIVANGYETYRRENLQLATSLVASLTQPTIFVTASGFLAAAHDSADYRQASALVDTGYGVTLLPSSDLATATEIVVDRQMSRGYTSDRAGEISKFERRFGIYRDKGDMLVLSTAPPDETARAVIERLDPRSAGGSPQAPAGSAIQP